MAKRKTSDSVRKMRLIILGIALALIVAVVAVTWFTLSRESENGKIEWKIATTTTTEKRVAGQPDETTTAAASNSGTDTDATTNADGLPYDKLGSDRYAEWDGKYPTAEVVVKKGSDGKWGAYVGDELKKDCTGVYCNEHGWWFVRNGYVDFDYNGIAGNNKGKWYVVNGKCNFAYSGAYKTHDTQKYYTLSEGRVVELENS